MSKGKHYTQEFKVEAIKQITDRGYSVLVDMTHNKTLLSPLSRLGQPTVTFLIKVLNNFDKVFLEILSKFK